MEKIALCIGGEIICCNPSELVVNQMVDEMKVVPLASDAVEHMVSERVRPSAWICVACLAVPQKQNSIGNIFARNCLSILISFPLITINSGKSGCLPIEQGPSYPWFLVSKSHHDQG